MATLIATVSYVLPLFAYFRIKAPTLSPTTFFLFFFMLNYGPHTLNPGWMRMTALYPAEIHDAYAWGIVVANLAIATGLLFSQVLGLRHLSAGRFRKAAATLPQTVPTKPLLVFAIIYAVAFVLVDGPTAPRLTEIIRYYLNTSLFSYEEIRRELFAGSAIETLMNYTRQSTSAILITLCVLTSLRVRRLFSRVIVFCAAILVFVTASLQLNKFAILYVAVVASISSIIYFTACVTVDRKILIRVVMTALLVLGGLQALYFVQYRDALSSGLVTAAQLQSVVVYRAALTQADALRMWFAEFPLWTPFLGLSNVAMLSDLTGGRYVNVTSLIPSTYVGNYDTTFQAGFIGSGYASFGYFGIFAYGAIVGFFSVQLGGFSNTIRNFSIRAAYLGVSSMNVYFFNSRELSVAFLSGGILLAPLAALLFDRLLLPTRTAGNIAPAVALGFDPKGSR